MPDCPNRIQESHQVPRERREDAPPRQSSFCNSSDGKVDRPMTRPVRCDDGLRAPRLGILLLNGIYDVFLCRDIDRLTVVLLGP